MLKTSSIKLTELKKCVVGIGDGRKEYINRAEVASKYEVDTNEMDSDKIDDKVGKNQKTSKSKKMVRSSDFLTSRAKLAFTKLR